jgi:hypothetical protein
LVPQYKWVDGCGPTAVATVLAYYDASGLAENLFKVSGFKDLSDSSKVAAEISSPEHNAKYGSKLGDADDASLPDPPDVSIADFFHTSEDIEEYPCALDVDLAWQHRRGAGPLAARGAEDGMKEPAAS